MKKLLALIATLVALAHLSGCMAIALAPIANSFTDKPVNWQYTTTARKAPVFNAAVKAISAKGTTTTVDRETGTIRGDISVSMGQAAYNVVVIVEERAGKTTLNVSAKLEGVAKFDLKNSSDLANELVQDIERQIGARLERT